MIFSIWYLTLVGIKIPATWTVELETFYSLLVFLFEIQNVHIEFTQTRDGGFQCTCTVLL